MNFKVDERKTADATARILEKSGGSADYLRIAKLIYLADRESILKRGIPIVGGRYLSMNKGPTISEFMDLVKQRSIPEWKAMISPRFGNTVTLQSTPLLNTLSEAEIEILDAVIEKHQRIDTRNLVEFCHQECPEYEYVPIGKSKPIPVENILKAAKISAERASKIVAEAESLAKMDSLFA